MQGNIFLSTIFALFGFEPLYQTGPAAVYKGFGNYVTICGYILFPFESFVVEKSCPLSTLAIQVSHAQVFFDSHTLDNFPFRCTVFGSKSFEHTVLHHIFEVVDYATVESKRVIIVKSSDFRIIARQGFQVIIVP